MSSLIRGFSCMVFLSQMLAPASAGQTQSRARSRPPRGVSAKSKLQRGPSGSVLIKTAGLRLDYDLSAGLWTCRWRGGAAIEKASCYARLADGRVLTPTDYRRHEWTVTEMVPTPSAFGLAGR